MRLLSVHNEYGVRSGEEIQLERIEHLLEEKGHSVRRYRRSSVEICSRRWGRVGALVSGVWSAESRSAIDSILTSDRPDLVFIQNLYPLISPSVLPIIAKHELPVVMRVPNYRLVCPSGLHFSHGELCQRCLGGKEYWCVLRNCEGSAPKSFGYALRNYNARRQGWFRTHVDRFIAPTEFIKERLVAAGYDERRITVLPNVLELNEHTPCRMDDQYVGFAGRLSVEKGIRLIIDAARMCPDIPFKLAGPFREGSAYGFDVPNIELVGSLNKNELDTFYNGSRLMIFPSVWYEGYPNALAEAMGHACPCIVPELGGFTEMSEQGESCALFRPGDATSLADEIRKLWNDRDRRLALGARARSSIRLRSSPEQFYRAFMRTVQELTTSAT